jgi:hypothetical protein
MQDMRPFEVGETALMVGVPEAEPVVARWRERFDSSAAFGVPAHVTVLYPFLRRDVVEEGALAELFAARSPFEVGFERCARFPGVLYLAPEPAGPLRALTDAVVARWPEAVPYGGKYEPVPHLTVTDGADLAMMDAIEAELTGRLPVRTRAVEVELIAFDGETWRRAASFPLGGAR